jgi:hypothetical protein
MIAITLLEYALQKIGGSLDLPGLKAVYGKFMGGYRQMEGTTLLDASKSTRVRPITVISADLMTLPELDSVLQNILSVFTAYYLQAIAVNNTINGVSVEKLLSRFNPGLESFNNKHWQENNYAYTLPKLSPSQLDISLEAAKLTEVEVDKNDTLKESPNLSIGKLINVSVTFNEPGIINPKTKVTARDTVTTATIPVLVQLASFLMSNSIVTQMMSTNSVDRSFAGRWQQYKSGQIEFINDLILCNDIIDEQRKLLLSDESDTYYNILKRISKGQWKYLSHEGESFAAASTIYVISEEVAKDIEYNIGGKLDSHSVRQRLFKGNYGMILVVLDREWERATFYYRGMDSGTVTSFKALKNSANKGMDIFDVFKSLNSGNSPIF